MNPERLVLFQAIARAWPRDTCRTLYQVHVSLNHDLPAIIDIQSLRTGLASEAATVMVYHTSDIGPLTSVIVLMAVGVTASIHWK